MNDQLEKFVEEISSESPRSSVKNAIVIGILFLVLAMVIAWNVAKRSVEIRIPAVASAVELRTLVLSTQGEVVPALSSLGEIVFTYASADGSKITHRGTIVANLPQKGLVEIKVDDENFVQPAPQFPVDIIAIKTNLLNLITSKK
jgi:hypothetical protein